MSDPIDPDPGPPAEPARHPAPPRRAAQPPPPPDDDLDPDDPVVHSGREKLREPTAYEKRLRTESQGLRQRLRASEAERATELAAAQAEAARQVREAKEAVKATVAQIKADHDAKIAEATAAAEAKAKATQTAGQTRIIRAEVRAAAVQAGLRHTKGLDMMDLSTVTMNDDGEVVIPEDFMTKAKADYPFLFNEPPAVVDPKTSTSSTANPPPQQSPQNKKGMELTRAEWAAKRREIVHGSNP